MYEVGGWVFYRVMRYCGWLLGERAEPMKPKREAAPERRSSMRGFGVVAIVGLLTEVGGFEV